MRKYLFTILFTVILLVSINKSYSQAYIPMLADSNTWLYIDGSLDSAVHTTTYSYSTNGIVTLDYVDSLEWYIVSPGTTCFIREDTVLRELYWFQYYPVKDYSTGWVLFNFSLNENDSIELYDFSGWSANNLGYFNVDSIILSPTLLGDRKHFYLSSKNKVNGYLQNAIWIEGVGPVGDIMNSGVISKYNSLNCAYKNEEQTYVSQNVIDFGNCNIYIYVDVPEIENQKEYNIFPNPASTNLTIDFVNNLKSQVLIFNNTGQIILDKTFINEKEINIESLKTGLYFLKITNNENIYFDKILIE